MVKGDSWNTRQIWKELKVQTERDFDRLLLGTTVEDELPSSTEEKKTLLGTEMPKFRNVILIATYLASYNHPKSDKKYFWKV